MSNTEYIFHKSACSMGNKEDKLMDAIELSELEEQQGRILDIEDTFTSIERLLNENNDNC